MPAQGSKVESVSEYHPSASAAHKQWHLSEGPRRGRVSVMASRLSQGEEKLQAWLCLPNAELE